MKKPEPIEPALIAYLEGYNRELKKFLALGFTEPSTSFGKHRERELTYIEKNAILSEIVRVEREIRVLSYYADTSERFHERLMEHAEENGRRVETVRSWRQKGI